MSMVLQMHISTKHHHSPLAVAISRYDEAAMLPLNLLFDDVR